MTAHLTSSLGGRGSPWRWAAGGLIVAVVVVAGLAVGAVPGWYRVLPPLAAVVLAFVWRRLMPALLLAVLLGGLLVAVPQGPSDPAAWLEGVGTAGRFFLAAATDSDHLTILISVMLMLGMITLAIAAGGFAGLIRYLARWARGRRSTNGCTALLGVALFFDDYSNCVLIGSTMRPLCDRHRISRAKLAFLVDATAAPIAGVAVVSTWIGYEVGLFRDVSQQLQWGRDGFALFLDALGFRFYCWLMLLFVVINIVMNRDFGPMAAAERAAVLGRTTPSTAITAGSPLAVHQSLWAAVVPMGVLVGGVMVGLWLDGDGLGKWQAGGSLLSLGYWQAVLTDVQHSVQVIAVAAALSLVTAIVCAGWLGGLSPAAIVRGVVHGGRLAVYPNGVLVSAWALQNACQALETGNFLAAAISGQIPPEMFPALLFLLAAVTALATGTSWGTMAILIPTAIPIAHQLDGGQYGWISMVALAAVLDGAIFGDHCSPISDTTILSAASSGCPLMTHVATQLPYGLVVAAAAVVVGYLPAAMGVSTMLSFIAAAVIFILLHRLWGVPPVTPAGLLHPEPGAIAGEGTTQRSDPAQD